MTYAQMKTISNSAVMTKTVTCPFCGRTSSISATAEQWERYMLTNEPVQSIFPNLSASDRELLISQICHNCQSDFFTE